MGRTFVQGIDFGERKKRGKRLWEMKGRLVKSGVKSPFGSARAIALIYNGRLAPDISRKMKALLCPIAGDQQT
jgi:hypothetical protein